MVVCRHGFIIIELESAVGAGDAAVSRSKNFLAKLIRFGKLG